MGNLILATPDWSDDATIQALTEAAERPATNMQRLQPRVRWQSVGPGPHRIDVVRPGPRAFNLISLLHTNATEEATWRIRSGSSLLAIGLGSTSYDSTGGFGSCARFLTSTSRVWVVGSAALNVGTFTLEAQIRPRLLRRQGILTRSGGSLSAALDMDADGRIRFVGMPGVVGNLLSPNPVPVREWTHIAGTYNASTQAMVLYVNGEAVATGSSIVAAFDGESLEISSVEGERYYGEIDDVRFWNVERTGSQISAAYQTELGGGETGLVGYWKLNEATGSSAADSSSGGHTGALQTGARFSYPMKFRVPWAMAGSDGEPLMADIDPFATHHALWFLKAGVTDTAIRIDILDPTNPDGHLRVGRAVVSSAWQCDRNELIGSDLFGFQDLSPIEELPSGPSVPMAIQPKATKRFTIRSTNEREMMENAYEIAARRGASRDVLVVANPEESAFLQQKMIYGRLHAETAAVHAGYSVYEQPFTVTEFL